MKRLDSFNQNFQIDMKRQFIFKSQKSLLNIQFQQKNSQYKICNNRNIAVETTFLS